MLCTVSSYWKRKACLWAWVDLLITTISGKKRQHNVLNVVFAYRAAVF